MAGIPALRLRSRQEVEDPNAKRALEDIERWAETLRQALGERDAVFTAASVALTSGVWTVVQTAAFKSIGNPVLLLFGFRPGTLSATSNVRLRRDASATIWSVSALAVPDPFFFAYEDTGASEAEVSYTLEVQDAHGTPDVTDRFLSARESWM